ncbi:hypothetical protein PGT21_030559 [Puccinia graminis f. sp. tritici]|uniref:Uncharacterized protein n=1 Tax=Puccinia graminis f. sp. tritici TaxID=56615 RepID=A0A5B0QBU7_PUCGR|nr:hypothetical protein PGT21_030559 [Puccinia graminis f. sp. tritici]
MDETSELAWPTDVLELEYEVAVTEIWLGLQHYVDNTCASSFSLSENSQAFTDTVTTGINQWSENLEDGGVLDEELDSADRLVLSVSPRLPSR